ncbi:MAG: DUF4384 domain-containing protein [Polyangiaceae bacterium]|nr:DUF4384 domain-containing protein [Polyangiaceae bacterium]
MKTLQRTRGTDCLSDLQMDRWAAKELDAETERAFAAHLLACARCKDRREEMNRTEAMFFSVESASTTASSPASNVHSIGKSVRSRRDTSRLFIAASPILALAAGAFLYLRGAGPISEEETRTKGTSHIEVFRKRGESVIALGGEDSVMPGDQLRFVYSSPRPRYMAVLSVDGMGHANTYFPEGSAAAYAEPGSHVPLPGAVELDAVLGDETVLAIFCEHPFDLGPLRQALEKSQASSFAPKDCTVDRIHLRKVGSP